MKSLILILILIAPSCFAESINDLILKLNNDDFEIREQASEELSNYPKDYAFIFKRLAESFQSEPEIAVRLLEASKAVFFKTILEEDIRWKQFAADSGMEMRDITSWMSRIDSEQKEYTLIFAALHVYWVDDEGTAFNKVKEGDYIIKINNIDLANRYAQSFSIFNNFEVGKEVELTLRTYKNSQEAEESETYDTSPHEDRVVKIKIRRKADNKINWKDGSRLVLTIYDDFEIAYNNYFIKGIEFPKN